jgi:anti-anti-sigma factor
MTAVRMGSARELTISVHGDEACVVLHLEGYLGEDNAELLRRAITTLLEDNKQRVVLDLRSLATLDMPGVRVLIELVRNGEGLADRIRIIGVRPASYELLTRTGLMRLVSVTPYRLT